MENQPHAYEMNDNQRRVFIDAAQLHEAYTDAFTKSRAYRGGMHWKKSKGKAYLFRSLDRYGYGKSLGPRSSETEAVFNQFHQKKKRRMARLKHLKVKLQEQARFCKAARITRVPAIVTAILRILEQHNLLGRNLQIVGTNALYAYEARAGIFFDRGLLATRDMDVLWDTRPQLRLIAVDDFENSGLINLLQKADRSFDLASGHRFRAINKTGYMVDLIKPEPKPLIHKEINKIGAGDDLIAAEIKNLNWLMSTPKFKQIVIGEDGFPATMVVPDPRAFAIHKLWVSNQKNRDPLKKKRDRAQAHAIGKMIAQYLPEFRFKKEELRMFPNDLFSAAHQELDDSELPPGYTE